YSTEINNSAMHVLIFALTDCNDDNSNNNIGSSEDDVIRLSCLDALELFTMHA
ncbi:hypothetical protein ACJX0J_024408, partial [Zea mays]